MIPPAKQTPRRIIAEKTDGIIYGRITNMKFQPQDREIIYNLATVFEVVVPQLRRQYLILRLEITFQHIHDPRLVIYDQQFLSHPLFPPVFSAHTVFYYERYISKKSQEDLWRFDEKTLRRTTKELPNSILKEQADLLAEKTDGIIYGRRLQVKVSCNNRTIRFLSCT